MKKYDHKKIEKKWQNHWEENAFYRADDSDAAAGKQKFYSLVEFPFPSGSGLHTGHVRSYTGMDIVSRKKRAEGMNVLYPIGWDAFGLPTENYAIKTGELPQKVTKDNTDNYRRQLKELGISFDWSREINTTDPKYYKWTQWIFIQMFKKGLAYKAKMAVNWCPKDKTVLANEEVINGRCERCGTEVEKRDKEQWMLAITKYADRLHKDLDEADYWDKIKIQQRNWIGKSEGSEIDFKVKDSDEIITVFTTRADTQFGVTYVVVAPESELIQKLKGQIKNFAEVEAYIAEAKKKEDIDRTAEEKDKTGIILDGVFAINPATGEEVPVWTADYVLATYGTGAVMAVPAHDERDMLFARKYGLPVRTVVDESGKLVESGKFTGMASDEAKKTITDAIGGRIVTKYKLRDWVFSRQRYWGEPIPMIHCEKCGWNPVAEADLPVELPAVKKYEPTDTGESPLAAIPEWVKAPCPSCGGEGRRETDTMPQWAGSSWYYLRYTDPTNDTALASPERLKKWTPVDWYNGGMEHTTLHLLYSRFWHKFLHDIGVAPTVEPYAKRTSQGMILAEGGVKMSKSKGNVINPDDLVKLYGADTLRVYEMFMGPFDQAIPWNTSNMIGSRRFIERSYNLAEKVRTDGSAVDNGKELESLLHKSIKKVGEDIESLGFNTAISTLMILLNALEKCEEISKADYEAYLKLLAPFAPHVADELWEMLGNTESIHLAPWPQFDAAKMETGTYKIVVQINSKVRAQFVSETDDEAEVVKQALALRDIAAKTGGAQPDKVFYVKGKLVNLVIAGN